MGRPVLFPKPICWEERVFAGCFEVSSCPLRPAAIPVCCWWMESAGRLWPRADVVSVVFSCGKHVCVRPCSVAHGCLKIF